MQHLPLLLFLALFACSNEPADAPQAATRTSADVVLEKGKERLLNQLKAPSTAVFIDSLCRVQPLRSPDNSFAVHLTVDAQNSFGAMLRNRYMATFEQTGPDSLNAEDYTVVLDF